MRTLLIGLAALLLAACASPKQELVSAPSAPRQVIAVGTLSTNACEAAVAPTYTRAITVAEVAESRLRAGKLSPSVAQQADEVIAEARRQADAIAAQASENAQRIAEAAQARLAELNRQAEQQTAAINDTQQQIEAGRVVLADLEDRVNKARAAAQAIIGVQT